MPGPLRHQRSLGCIHASHPKSRHFITREDPEEGQFSGCGVTKCRWLEGIPGRAVMASTVKAGSDFLKLTFNRVRERFSDVVSVWGSPSPLSKGMDNVTIARKRKQQY